MYRAINKSLKVSTKTRKPVFQGNVTVAPTISEARVCYFHQTHEYDRNLIYDNLPHRSLISHYTNNYHKSSIFIPDNIQSSNRVFVRNYATPQKSSSFISRVRDNIMDDKGTEQLKKIREDLDKDLDELDKSDLAVAAREKYQKIQSETARGTEKTKQQIKDFSKGVADKAINNEILQKAGKIGGAAASQVRNVGQNIAEKGEEIAKTQAYKRVSDTATAVKEEFEQSAFSGAGMQVYRPPVVLRMRTQINEEAEKRIIEANTRATGLTVTKDFKLGDSWDNFKKNNTYVNQVLNWKTKIDESDHIIVRATSAVKDKMQELFGSMLGQTDLSETLTAIVKIDPAFDKDKFLLEMEYDIIPNILEAMVRPDEKILEDWASERVFAVVAQDSHRLKTLGHKKVTKILDVDNVDLMMGKMLPEGPILVLSFQAQCVNYEQNSKGEVVEGARDKVMRRHYVWVMVRDQEDFNHRSAWKLMEQQHHETEQLL